jgi:streptomycin 6-kinase
MADDDLVAIAADVAEEWGLTLGDPYPPGVCGHVVRAEPDAVLKVSIRDRETELEADALAAWDGDGAIRLLRRHDRHFAMLLERCEPGTYLSRWDGDRLGVLIELLPRLWRTSPDGFHTLEDEVEYWIERGLDPGCARELASTQGERVLAHQDLHGDNVLAAEREPWLVIDPKPLSAEREFAIVPIVRSPELGHSKRDVFYRLDRLCEAFALDRERARQWVVVQTTAWGGSRQQLEVLEWVR